MSPKNQLDTRQGFVPILDNRPTLIWTCYNLELLFNLSKYWTVLHKVPQLVYWTPVWGKTGDEIKKKVKMKTREEQTSFLNDIRPHKSLTPSFLLALLAPLIAAGSYSSLNKVLSKRGSANLMSWYPVLWNGRQFHSLYEYTLKFKVETGFRGSN